MLKAEDNERLTRVGPGTPGGDLFRRYWQPALLSSELPEPDCAPVRVKMLGEELLAFRDTEGRVGLVDAFCPHRLAPLFYGRNEECGLRCVYHGWKFDVDGNCTDLPTEAPGSPMRNHIKLTAYPTVERGGVVWTYMGPKETMPAEPDYEWLRAPPDHLHVNKTYQACNYLQALEGGLDTAHSSYLHNNKLGSKAMLRNRDTAPKLDVHRSEYGYSYVSDRDGGEQGRYVRVYHYIMPAQQLRGNITARDGSGRAGLPKIDGHVWVPMDDETTCVWNFAYTYDASASFTADWRLHFDIDYGRGPDDFVPGTFWLKRNAENDYMIDRAVQKTQTFTGIKGINTQDYALQEWMKGGRIVDRRHETLGSTDRAIVMMRRMMLEAISAVQRGEMPPGVQPATHRDIRPHDGIVPHGSDWREVFARELVARW